jgi:hypothetical protein
MEGDSTTQESIDELEVNDDGFEDELDDALFDDDSPRPLVPALHALTTVRLSYTVFVGDSRSGKTTVPPEKILEFRENCLATLDTINCARDQASGEHELQQLSIAADEVTAMLTELDDYCHDLEFTSPASNAESRTPPVNGHVWFEDYLAPLTMHRAERTKKSEPIYTEDGWVSGERQRAKHLARVCSCCTPSLPAFVPVLAFVRSVSCRTPNFGDGQVIYRFHWKGNENWWFHCGFEFQNGEEREATTILGLPMLLCLNALGGPVALKDDRGWPVTLEPEIGLCEDIDGANVFELLSPNPCQSESEILPQPICPRIFEAMAVEIDTQTGRLRATGPDVPDIRLKLKLPGKTRELSPGPFRRLRFASWKNVLWR